MEIKKTIKSYAQENGYSLFVILHPNQGVAVSDQSVFFSDYQGVVDIEKRKIGVILPHEHLAQKDFPEVEIITIFEFFQELM